MEKKSTISKKTLKIILGICIARVTILAVAGLFGYIHGRSQYTGPENFRVGSGGFRLDAKQAEEKIHCGI